MEHTLFAWSMAMSVKEYDVNHENGDKIILPENILRGISRKLDKPIYCKLINTAHNTEYYTGVLEFSATTGNCFIPHWIMSQTLIEEGNPVKVEIIMDLNPVTYLKLKPQDPNIFNTIPDVKQLLEFKLKNYTCTSKGSWLCVSYFDEKIYFDVIDTKPDNVVSLLDTECTLEFDLPVKKSPPMNTKFQKEEKKQQPKKNFTQFKKTGNLVKFPGKGRRLCD